MKSNFDFRKFAQTKLDVVSEDIPETEFYDTGSYALNALVSANIFGGVPSNRITGFAGESGTGKSYLIQGILSEFLKKYPDGGSFLYETEFATDKKSIKNRNIDEEAVILQYPETVEEFRNKLIKVLDDLAKVKDELPRMLFILDSLGNLSSNKELNDALEDKNVADMTRQKAIRSAFRVLTLKLGKLGFPLLIANHTYKNVGGYGPPDVVSGGGGFIYAASTIITLSKAKDSESEGDADDKTTVQKGLILTATTYKSRYSKVGQKVKLKLDFDKGLDRYYGLTEIALEAEIFKKDGKKKIILPGEEKSRFRPYIDKNSATIFTPEILEQINDFVKTRFALGAAAIEDDLDEEDTETED